MNPANYPALLASIGGNGLWQTNPVYCIEELIRRCQATDLGRLTVPTLLRELLDALAKSGTQLPSEALSKWCSAGLISESIVLSLESGDPVPGVIGLAVDGDGYVLPLCPRQTRGEWKIDDDLPRLLPLMIQDGLASLLHEAGLSGDAVPERDAFVFENPLGRRIYGDSLTIAAILSVLRCLEGGLSPLLRTAVSLVQPASGRRLVAVSDIPAKLTAAHREYGRLSLVVMPAGVEIDTGRVEVVWPVESVADLARFLHAAGLLAPLLAARGSLSRTEATRVLDRLRRLIRHEHNYRDAAYLGDRVRKCGLTEPADTGVRVELARLHAEACRHHGRFADAVEVSSEAHASVAALGDLGCDDDEADATAEYAASLFSGHCFREIPGHLQRWSREASDYPRRFRPITRVKVWNTLARGLAILGENGWDELFARSTELHRQLNDLDEVARTTHYQAHAHLRRRDVAAALKALEERGGPAFPRPGNAWDAFLRAKLAILQGESWLDLELERQLETGAGPYSVWLYVQAVARQPTRRPEDAVERLNLTIRLLRREAEGIPGNVCNLFAEFFELNTAARLHDGQRWRSALEATHKFLSTAPGHRAYYHQAVDTLPTEPNLDCTEELLDRVPYL